ncbi:MAG: amidohydrolase [Candidatus Korarchaeum sp.]
MLLAIENARVMGSYERSCVIVRDDRVLEVGSSSTCEKYRGNARFLDAEGRVLIPGIVDSHMHLLSYALSMRRLDLRGIRSLEELREAVRSKVRTSKPGEWIVGHGWDQEALRDRRYPRASDLDEVSPENPVILTRVCLHAGVLNSRAMRELGIRKDLLFEEELYEAMRRVVRITKGADHLMLKAVMTLLAYGITEVHSMDASPEELAILRGLLGRGALPLRVRVYLSEGLDAELNGDLLSVDGIKVYADGSFGARTAALREDYEDQPGNRGSLLRSWREIASLAASLRSRGKRLAVHAIGDRALEEVVKALESGATNLRIEHASLTPPDLMERLSTARPEMVAVQPHFAVTDWWLTSRLGNRVKHAYRFREMVERGLRVSGSSDSPVEPANPWMSIEAAVTGGELGIDPMSLEQALSIYTHDLAPGARADLILLDQNPWGLNRFDLSGVRSSLTLIGGLVVYDQDGASGRCGWPEHPFSKLISTWWS